MTQRNYVELTGVVGSVCLRNVGGKNVARLTLATNYAYKAADGTPVISTSWHSLTCWEGPHVRDLESIGRADKLHVTGRLQYQRYTDVNGNDRTAVEIAVLTLEKIRGDEPLELEM